MLTRKSEQSVATKTFGINKPPVKPTWTGGRRKMNLNVEILTEAIYPFFLQKATVKNMLVPKKTKPKQQTWFLKYN